MIRRLLPLAGVLIAISSTAARAETPGLTVTGTHAGETCWTSTVPNLVLSWGGGPIGDCPADQVTLRLEGSVFSGGPNEAWFAASDDGIRITVDGTVVYDAWFDRSCWGDWFTPALTAGWHTLEIDWYENGGGTCLYVGRNTETGFAWFDGYSLQASTPTTTTTEPATTSTSSSTTSTTPPTTTTLPEPTTTVPAAPETSTTQPQVTTTMQMVSTTIQPIQQTTAGSPTTQPPNTVPSTSTTQSPPTSTENPTITQYTSTSSSLPERSTTTTVAPPTVSSAEAVSRLLEANLAALNPDDAGDLFAAIDENDLTPTEAAALVAAVQTAPTSIRASFEKNVNIFAGATDTYVPLGSRVPVRTRRIIIITTGLLVAMPSPRRTR